MQEKQLRALRERVGLEQRQLAALLAVPQTALALAEQGRLRLPPAVLRRASKLLAVPDKSRRRPVQPNNNRAKPPRQWYVMRSGGEKFLFSATATPHVGDLVLVRRGESLRVCRADSALCGGDGVVAVAVKRIKEL